METTRKAYSVDQLRAALAAAMVRYNRATTCADAAMWLRSQHSLRDRISFEQMQRRIAGAA